jgi:hypothetical protein
MLRLILVGFLSLLRAEAVTPNLTCGGLPYDSLAVGASPVTLAVAFAASGAYAVFDSGQAGGVPGYFAVNFPSGSCASIQVFAPPPGSSVASQTIAGGDFNGDGFPDAASLTVTRGQISVFLGDATGVLSLKASYNIGASPASVIAADFNGDGKLDLIIADSGVSGSTDRGSIVVLIGNGDGTFQTPARYTAGTSPVSVAVADFNGDGRLDLAVANSQSASVSILLGVGDGTFRSSTPFLVDNGPRSIVTADFNADGKPDLAVSNSISDSIAILLGNGDGTFQDPISFPVAAGPGFLASGDFNHDGKADLAVLFDASNTLSIFLGSGDGFLARPVSYVVGTSTASLALVDLEGDGTIDILAPDSSSRRILILRGKPEGTFGAAPLYPVGAVPASVVAADFNGDGNADLVIPNRGSSDYSILLGKGDGTFRVLPRAALFDPDSPPRPSAVGVGDFNGDGIPDLAIAIGAPLDRVTILLGRGDGTFRTGGNFKTGADPASIVVADFNGDGNLDLATANLNQTSSSDFGNVTVLLGNGDGTFSVPVGYDAGARPFAITAGDFNNDGILDLAIGSAGDPAVQQPPAVALFLGQGDGTFQPAQYVIAAASRVASARAGSIAAGDLNLDGNLDLVFSASSSIAILTGAGDGTFQATTIPTSSPASSLAIADINGSGPRDLLITHAGDDVSYILGNGDGTFQPEAHIPGGASPVWAAVSDFNGDGKQDLAIADAVQSGTVAILLNRLMAQ